MSFTVVTSSSPVGAGRIIDCSVDMNNGAITSFATGFTATARNAFGGRLTGSALQYLGTAGVTNSATVAAGTYQSRFCNRYGSAGVSGFQSSPINMTMPTVQPTYDLQGDAAINNMRFIFTIARSGSSAQATPLDCGISFVPNSVALGTVYESSVIQQAGFGVFYDASGHLWWASRPSLLPVSTPPPDLVELTTDAGTDWHEIEFRFQAAQQGTDATVNVIVDGVDTVSRNWGAGTQLPTAASVPLTTVFGFGIVWGHNSASYVDAFYASQIRFVAASTFSSMF